MAKKDPCCPALLPEAEGLLAMAGWKARRSSSRTETLRLEHKSSQIHEEDLVGQEYQHARIKAEEVVLMTT